MEDPFQIRTIIERFKARQVEYYLHYNLHPCTDDDIQFLEQELGCQLPATYVQFLKWAGRSSANLFTVTDARYNYGFIVWMQEMAREMMQWDRTPPTFLPDDAIVISVGGQDADFDFFRLGEGDNPPVYLYQSGAASIERTAESFTAYLGQRVIETAKIHKIQDHFEGIGDVGTIEEVQKWVRQLIATLINSHFVGWSAAEIDALAREIGFPLPSSYKIFVEIGGHRAGTLAVVEDYSEIIKIQPYAREILLENNLPLTLPPSVFICNFYSEGSGFTFFDLTEGEDPPVYEFLLQSPELGFVKVADRFSQFLEHKATATKYPINHLSKYLPF